MRLNIEIEVISRVRFASHERSQFIMAAIIIIYTVSYRAYQLKAVRRIIIAKHNKRHHVVVIDHLIVHEPRSHKYSETNSNQSSASLVLVQKYT